MSAFDNTKDLKVPFSGAYWVFPDSFLAGCHPCFYAAEDCAELLSRIVDHGIRHFIDLTEAEEWIPGMSVLADYSAKLTEISEVLNLEIRYSRKPIIDRSIPMRNGMVRILDLIDESIANGLPVYVHCMGGIGRTGTVVGCYLARHGYAAGHDLIARIAELRNQIDFIDLPSPESRPQVEMVVSWQKGE
ncbi:MAG: protein-tyrosine phosphatase family protein [Desulfobacterales bacterium]|nr:protein-tyrosine phosphatase family protein [Desulfobacterales bacterium]